MKGGAINSYVRTINQNCLGQSGILRILVNITGDLVEVTEGKMGGNGFNEEEKVGVA